MWATFQNNGMNTLVFTRFKSQAIYLLIQQIVQAKTKKISKLRIIVPLWGESSSAHQIPQTKGK